MLNFVYLFRVYTNKTPIINLKIHSLTVTSFCKYLFHFVCHNHVCAYRTVCTSVRKIILLLVNTDTRNKEAEVN